MSLDHARAMQALLGPIDPESMAWMMERIEGRSFPPGFAVFHEGMAPHSMVLLLEGRLRISKLRPDKRQEAIAYVEPVALIGHAAVLGRIPYPTTVMACEASRGLRIPADLLEAGGPPQSRAPALRLLQASLRGMNAQLRAANARLYELAGRPQLVESLAADLGAWSLPQEP